MEEKQNERKASGNDAVGKYTTTFIRFCDVVLSLSPQKSLDANRKYCTKKMGICEYYRNNIIKSQMCGKERQNRERSVIFPDVSKI